jgi:hypothetical protein
MMNMFDPAMTVPVPSATHWYVVGAEICRYMLPAAAEAEDEGTPAL